MKYLPEQREITSFGNGGFRFGDHSHRGHLMILPSGMRGWDGADIAPLVQERDHIDFLLMGTGAKHEIWPEPLIAKLLALGLRQDTMSTSAAIRTYNVMHAEKRRVAALLIAVP